MPYKNTEDRRQNLRKWRREHPERMREHNKRKREYVYRGYSEKIKEAHQRWIKNNPEKVKAYRIKRRAHQTKYMKIWQKRHPGYNRKYKNQWKKRNRDKVNLGKKLRRCKMRGIEGSHTLKEWELLKKKYNYCCAICGMQEPFTDQWYQWLTEDHIIPISKDGTNKIDNIQPACMICNSKKGKS